MATNKASTRSAPVKNGLLATPPMPRGLPKANLTDNARQVLVKRYVRRGDDGKPAETVEEMFWRVAYHVAKVEEQWDADVQKRTVEYYHLLSSKKFFPNSPTFTGAGTPLGQLAACFVLPITDDMGRDSAGIFQTLRDAALIQQTGGGNGFSFSRLRPKGALVQTSAGQATGPVGFLRVYDHAFGEIAQGGCLLPETLVFTDKGLLRLDEIVMPSVPGWQEHVLSVPTDAGMKDSPRGYNNGLADVFRVHTRQGLNITGTPNHKVKIMSDSGPQWKEIQDLAKGDWIIVRLGEHRGNIQALKKPTKMHGNQVMPQMPPIIDEELAFFLGYLAGDGFVAHGEEDHRIGVSVAHSSYLMEELPAIMARLFNVKVHKMQKPNDGSATFVIDNRGVKEFLLLNGLGKSTSRDVSVPRLIRQSPASIVGAYLRGLFEADGTLTHGYPTLVTTSARLAREVSTLLIGLGCPVSTRTVSAGLDRWGDTESYQVRITSSVGLQAWREKIGCDQRSRFVAAYAWESDQRRESSYVLPNPRYWLQPVLDAITLEQIDQRGRGRNINFRATDARLRRSVLRYFRDERNLTRSGYDMLKAAHPEEFSGVHAVEGLWFVQVAGVESVGRSLTLDLEVADNHTYLAYGMVTHNTRRGANMAVLRVDHPDVEEFVASKTNENHITNFNISVGITDAFMRAVKEDKEWQLRFPDIAEMKEHKFSGTLEQAEEAGITIRGYQKVKARDLFNKIVKQAHHNGEPGVLFLDAANRGNPVPHLYPLEATNPCITGDTLIYTDQGLRRADELAAEGVEINVVTDARFGTDTLLPATHVFQTGTKPVYRLMTREGYELRLTEDHRVMTSRGWVETRELHSGDRLHILNRKGGFGSVGTLEEGRVLGWLVGDGTVNVVRAVLSFFGQEKRELAPAFAEMVTMLVEKPTQRRAYPVGITQVEERDEARIASDRLRVWAAQYGITEAKKYLVPSAVLAGSENMQRGFLQALFTADGQVNDGGEKGCSVRLSASHLSLLKDIQRLLLNFGIASRIYENRRLAGYRPMPDGKGGTKEYFHQPQHDLAISKSSLIRFADEIGFLTEAKQGKLVNYLSHLVRGPYEESFLASVLAVEPDGVEPVYDLYQQDTHSFVANGLVVHNCGEQWLGPYENCCLGSVNLNEHCGPDGSVAWELLRQSVVLATRFLDDVVEANAYVPAVPQLQEAAHRARRIGLGIMGLADLMYHVGVRYGSEEGQEFGAQVMEFVRYHAMKTSIELAEERGPFPAIEGSIYDMDNMTWIPPQSLSPLEHDWSRPEVQWDSIVAGIRRHGIRNAAQTTVAPTGTIATVAGCEGYGCEPVFALAYIRHVNDNGKDLRLAYASPRFDEALKRLGLGEEKRQEIVDQVMRQGSCQQVKDIPRAVRDTFVVSADITAEEHVRMQAALQAFVDNSLSKTVNFPETATEEDVAKAYMLAWELGCKGITVYVTGSREKVVLETNATAEKKDTSSVATPPLSPRPELAPTFSADPKKPRPRALHGKTYNVETPVGKAFVTINENGGDQPFEAFINTAKAGSETAAVSEAIGRLISYILRMSSPTRQTDRLREIVRQLMGIGGGRSLGMGPNRVRSLPDGIGQVLDMYLREKTGNREAKEEKSNGNGGTGHKIEEEMEAAFQPMKIGDLCPECGEAAVVNEEGCRKCYACGFSEC
jgi:ribonucleoside-diphosphate reductase alpha chain